MSVLLIGLVGLSLAGFSRLALAQAEGENTLMPLPREVSRGVGELVVGPKFRIEVEADSSDQMILEAVDRCRQSFEEGTGLSIPVKFVEPRTGSEAGALLIVVHQPAGMRMGVDERYTLRIAASGARLEAETGIGAVRGMATLRQWVRWDGKKLSLPVVEMDDAPRYEWRGLMIDVARHFIPIEVLKRNIDAMELVKLNVLHLHLSDNEGFRMESKVFPKLQGDGSKGEYYTQDQMRELIRYALRRGIVVVPEFDMPSHSMSWFAGYPELASAPGPYQPGTLKYEGITPHSSLEELGAAMMKAKVPAMDPTRDETYAFLDKFIGEMAGMFPSPYFHIGADENNGAVWLANPAIVAFMKEHKMADAAGAAGLLCGAGAGAGGETRQAGGGLGRGVCAGPVSQRDF